MMCRRLLIALFSVAALPHPATASERFNPRVYCFSPGNCHAIAYHMTDDLTDPSRSVFTVYLQNLQGSFAGSVDALFTISQFEFHWPGNSYQGIDPIGVNHRATGIATANAVGNVQYFSPFSSVPHTNLGFLDDPFQLGIGLGLLGCNKGPEAVLISDYVFRTCLPQGLNGWVRFDFGLYGYDYGAPGRAAPSRPTLDDIHFSIRGWFPRAGSNISEVSLGPSAGGGVDYQTFLRTHAIVTPEPATLTLFATGLGALGAGFARRRRR